MSVTGSGGSISRERAKLGNKNSRRLSLSKVLEEEQGEYTPVAISPKLEDSVVIDVTPIASSSVPLKIESKGTKKPLKRSVNLFIEKVTIISVPDNILFFFFLAVFVSSCHIWWFNCIGQPHLPLNIKFWPNISHLVQKFLVKIFLRLPYYI